MNLLLSVVLLIAILGFLVFVHELGHFLAAKLNGVLVEEFALGFGKKLFSFKFKETEYKLNLLPLGGYVKMLGDEDPTSFRQNPELKDNPGAYQNKRISQKMMIISGGVVINFFVAVIMFTIFLAGNNFKPDPIADIVGFKFVGANVDKGIIYSYVDENSAAGQADIPEFGFLVSIEGEEVISQKQLTFGDKDAVTIKVADLENNQEEVVLRRQDSDDIGIYILDETLREKVGLDSDNIFYSAVFEEGALAKAGGPTIGFIEKVDGEQVSNPDNLASVLNANENESVLVEIIGVDGQTYNIQTQLEGKVEDGKVKLGIYIDDLSVDFNKFYLLDYSDMKILSGFFHTINVTFYQALGLGDIIKEAFLGDVKLLADSVGSPIKVGEVVYQEVSLVDQLTDLIPRMINITAFVSAALAFMNALPIPLMDGGQFAILLLEKLRGRPMSARSQELLAKIGFAFLILLGVGVLLKDFWQVIIQRIF